MGIGPVPAVRKLLERAGIEVGDVDLVELNEAFASQSLVVIRELGLDPERVNVNGGAIALGHPLGMSGARLVVTLLHELRRRGGRYGLATLCVGVGQGQARFERPGAVRGRRGRVPRDPAPRLFTPSLSDEGAEAQHDVAVASQVREYGIATSSTGASRRC